MSATNTCFSSNYSEVTRDIRVSVVPAFLRDESSPDSSIFAFAYTVRIENLGEDTVQLLERHWIIMSAEVQVAEVVGPGVVGLQPTLHGGDQFEYTSSAVIHDPFGSMHGSYTFRSIGGSFFEVTIPRFDLYYPVVVH